MLKRSVKWFKGLSTASKIGVVGAFAALGIVGAATNPQQPQHKITTQALNQTPPCVAKISSENQMESIPFTKQQVSDSTVDKGSSRVTTQGANGEKVTTYKVTTYTPVGCKENTKEVSNITTTKQPVTEITSVGTKEPTPSISTAPAPISVSCTPLTNGGNCYEAGEYCRNSDHGSSGVAGNGEKIICSYNNGWRWEPF